MRHVDSPVFVGREAELAAITRCAEDATAGRATLVWIEGEAGAGKTALLERALETLPDEFTVLRAEADELAADVPMGVVGQLADVEVMAPFAVGLELVQRWAAEQDEGPVAVVVEDLHWADVRSREALLTAARRLGRDRVLMIVTSRPGSVDGWERLRLDARRCVRVEIAPLTPVEVATLAADSGVELSSRAAERLHRHTGGHALYVRTLLIELDPARLAEDTDELPAPRSLASTIIGHLATVPPPAREVALALAVVGRADRLSLVGAVAGVPDPTVALDDLLGTGLVAWQPGTQDELRFRHPLYRAAVLADLSPVRRRALHRAAAEVLGGRDALAHRVAAADGMDAGLAADLVAASKGELDRGMTGQAARYLVWASTVEPVRERAEWALLEGSRLLLNDGQLVRAAELRPRVESCADSPRRELVLGVLEREAGRAEAAEAALRRAAEQGSPDVAVAALAHLCTLFVGLGRGREIVEAAAQLLALPDLPPDVERAAWVNASLGEMFVAGGPAGLARLAQRLPQPPSDVPAADVALLVTRGTLGFYAGRSEAAIADLRAGIRLARRMNVETVLPRAHLQLAHLLVSADVWDEALVHARVALSLVDGERRIWIKAQAHAVLGRLHACRGDWTNAEEQITAAESAAGEVATPEAVFTACIARANLARARGEPREVIAAFTPVLGGGERQLPMATSLAWWPPIIAAAADVGDLHSAEQQLGRLRAAALERGLDLQAEIVGLDALLALYRGDTAAAVGGFTEAVELAGPDVQVLDRAELHHRFGRLLVGLGRRQDGIAQLRRACGLLAGAEPFLRRVESELAAAGTRAPRRGPRSPLGLTDRERDVVALVAAGKTNREAAAELYVSDKAVEYHLGNVYAKLGIRSRRELRERLRAPEAAVS